MMVPIEKHKHNYMLYGALFGLFQYRLDFFIVGYFLDIASVGLYSVGMTLAELLWRIPTAITQVLLPKIADISDIEANKLTANVCRKTSFIIVVSSCIMYLLSEFFIILLYGNEYILSINVVKLILPGICFASIWKVITNDFMARGWAIYYSYSAFLSFILIIVFDIILIPLYGIYGAAIASSISYFSSFIFLVFIFSIKTNQSLFFFLPTKNDIRWFYNAGINFFK